MEDIRSRLIGTWELISFSAHAPDAPTASRPLALLSDNCKGLIIYSADGYMMSILQESTVPQWDGGLVGGTLDQLEATVRGTMTYGGPFDLAEVPGKGPVLTHHVKMAVPPNWIGSDQTRLPRFSQENGVDYLTLTTENLMVLEKGGAGMIIVVKWRRAEREGD